jgi:O-antigen/teichoic acid export membrane protein
LPVGVLLTGLYQPLSYWAIRRKQFGLLAQINFRQSIFGLITNLSAAPLGTIGLLLGQIVSQSAGFVVVMLQSKTILWRDPQPVPAVLLKTIRQYSHFAFYSSPAGVINTIGSQLPTLIFASVFSASDVGQLAIAQRLLLLPAGFVGNAVSQVFLAQASSHWRLGTLKKFVNKAGVKLLCTGILLSLFMALIVAPLAPFVLGEQWVNVRQIVPLLIPLLIGQLTVSPLSMAFIVSENNGIDLFSQFGQAIIRLGILAAAVLSGLDFMSSVLAFSFGSLLGYACYAFALIFILDRQRMRLGL